MFSGSCTLSVFSTSFFIISFAFFAQAVPLQATGDGWLDEVAPLLLKGEREAFLALDDEAQRREFIRRFWEVRDPYPQTGRNELKESWEAGLAEARRRWGGLEDARTLALLLKGEPDAAFESQCPGDEERLEVWVYQAGFGEEHRTVLVFRRPLGAEGPARLWTPGAAGENSPPLTPGDPRACTQGEQLAEQAKWIRQVGDGQYRAVVEKALLRPRPEPRNWYEGFQVVSFEPPGAGEALAAGMEVDLPARGGESSVVRVMMTVPAQSLYQPAEPREMLVTGQVLEQRGVLEDFRYSFQVDPRVTSQPFIPLVFERYLRPGLYKLRVKLVDLFTKRFYLGEQELSVPELDGEALPPPAAAESAAVQVASLEPPAAAAGVPPELAQLYEEADAALSSKRPRVWLLRPGGNLLVGNTRFTARVEGGAGVPEESRIRRVSFLLDGRPIYTRNRPPYAVTLDLGTVPREHRLEVEGLNEAGEVVSRDELLLNSGAQRFTVRLLDPQPGRVYRQSLRARVQVEPPPGERVERVELYFNEDRVATLFQPPYTQPILLPQGQEVGYVRAVAHLDSGRAAEHTVLLNAPGVPDEMDVRVVELFATLLGPSGRPVRGFDPSGFAVVEDGVPQRIRVAEPVGDMPVRVVTLIDNSLSMRERLEDTRAAALQFLDRSLRPVDQAAVITFNRKPRVAVPLTNDREELADGLKGLVAMHETSLYDSLAFALQYLAGVSGQRAVLLLSDGMDRTSRFSYEQALEVARRGGIAVYTIGLALADGGKGEAAQKMTRLAAETGGRSFFVAGTDELDEVYAEIERELRAQYRIVYQSSNTSPEETFRAVRLEAGKKGLEARTISGYYP